MQAIYGYIDFGQKRADSVLTLMDSVLPVQDSAHSYSDANIALAVRRNPMILDVQTAICAVNEQRTIRAILIGEVCNAGELRAELQKKGYIFHTNGDTEVVLHLYEEYGVDLLKKLDGIVSFAVWDEKERQLTIGLDRYGGYMHLYYIATPHYFAFSSLVKPLLRLPQFTRQVNLPALTRFFTFSHILPPDTIFQGISKLAPGQVAVVKQGHVTIRWCDRFEKDSRLFTYDHEQLNVLLKKAVKERMPADRQIGFLISGGIDSSTILATAAGLSDRPLKTFNTKTPYQCLDESPYARIIVDYFKTDHHELELNLDRALEPLPDLIWFLEEPLQDASTIPVFHMLKFVRQHVQAVFSGDGPDHLFGRHYPLATRRHLLHWLAAVPGVNSALRSLCRKELSANKLLAQLQRAGRFSLFSMEQAYFDRMSQPIFHAIGVNALSKFLTPPLRAIVTQDIQLELPVAGTVNWFDHLAMIDFFVAGSFGVFEKIGRMAMANDIVLRQPFFDREVSDYIFRLPWTEKVGGNYLRLMRTKGRTKKHLYDGVASRLLPPKILAKRKAGFAPPTDLFIRQMIGDRTPQQIFCPELIQADYFDLDHLGIILRQHNRGLYNYGRLIYMLLVIDLWYRTFIAKDGSRPLGLHLSELYAG